MNIYLYLVELFHFLNELFISFYIFIFRTNTYDTIYILYVLINFCANGFILCVFLKKNI